jgi:hypothetical protein
MIQIKPLEPSEIKCTCEGNFIVSELIWQGLHICKKLVCPKCNKVIISSIPVNQSLIEQYDLDPDSGLIRDKNRNIVLDNWYSSKLKSILYPVRDPVSIEIQVIRKYDSVIILNTLDYIYGHSLLFLLNLQRIIESETKLGIIVIVQPMLKWLIPESKVAEIWTVNLGFREFNYFYPDLSEKINNELNRFREVFCSDGHIIPTNINIEIEKFTGIKPFNFNNIPEKPRITFIWREDPDRIWVRNIYLLKGFKKLGIGKILVPLQFLRLLRLFAVLKKRLNSNLSFTVAGLGTSFKFPAYIDDQRVNTFDTGREINLCRIYSESELIIGVHGSAMILPSAHAGMVLSLMPSKRWGNFAEDILFTENDLRLAAFQRRIIPLNLCIYDICDIITDMISGRDYFIRKFIHSAEL